MPPVGLGVLELLFTPRRNHGFYILSKDISLRGYDCQQTLCGTRKDRIAIFFFRMWSRVVSHLLFLVVTCSHKQ